jgi:hypothetical protein
MLHSRVALELENLALRHSASVATQNRPFMATSKPAIN